MLPEVRSSSEVYGETDPALLRRGRFRSPAIAGDQQAALFGQACFEPGSAKNTYGTGCFMLLNTGDDAGAVAARAADDGRLEDRRPDDLCARRLGVHRRRRRAVAARRAQGDHGVGRRRGADAARCRTPTASIWCRRSSASARRTGIRARAASIVGMTRNTHDRARRARRGRRDGVPDARRARGDAGRGRPGADDAEGRRRRRGQRDAAAVPGRPARRARCGGRSCGETTALGAAYLAGLAVGYWDGLDDVRRNWALDREFAPAMESRHARRLYAGWKKAVARSLAWED